MISEALFCARDIIAVDQRLVVCLMICRLSGTSTNNSWILSPFSPLPKLVLRQRVLSF